MVGAAFRIGRDLILVASHGRRGIEGVLLGSETRKVLTHSRLPILVCRRRVDRLGGHAVFRARPTSRQLRDQHPNMRSLVCRASLHLLLFLAIVGMACAGAQGDIQAVANPARLRPGEFMWNPALSPQGPVVVIVSLDEQRAYVYRNGIAIGLSTISSGREEYETPVGVFTILQKEREHYSNRYDNAPMPFMERLTWDGIALHGGAIPGYPASHGCVRLPGSFAEKLFEVTRIGTTVIVTHTRMLPDRGVEPVLYAADDGESRRDLDAGFQWNAAAQPDGPVGVLVGIRNRSVRVLRNGVEIGSARLEVDPGFELHAPHLFVIGESMDDAPSPLDPARPRHRWNAYAIASPGSIGVVPPDFLARHLRVPAAFARQLYAVLEPGATVLITELTSPDVPDSATRQTVLEADDDQPGRTH